MASSASVTAKIYDAWRDGHFLLLLSEPIVRDIADVVQRPEMLQKRRFSPVEAGALLLLLRRRGQVVTPEVTLEEIEQRLAAHARVLDTMQAWLDAQVR